MLNRLEHAPRGEPPRYHRIGHAAAATEGLFVELVHDAYPNTTVVFSVMEVIAMEESHGDNAWWRGVG